MPCCLAVVMSSARLCKNSISVQCVANWLNEMKHHERAVFYRWGVYVGLVWFGLIILAKTLHATTGAQ
jgi:hypothetical protein